jgi:chromosome segregation ATPase
VSSEKDSTVIYSTKQAVEKLEDLRGRTIEIVAQMEEKVREAKQFEGAELQKAQLEIGALKGQVDELNGRLESFRKANEAKQDEIGRLKTSLSESARPVVKTPEIKSGESDAEKLQAVLATIAEIGKNGGTFSGGSMKKAIEALVEQYPKE